MRTMKFRGKVEGNWWYVRVADHYTDGLWEQFWKVADRETVGQWTGLFDTHGFEIYEGDILQVDWHDTRYPPHIIEPVSWSAEDAGFPLGEGGSPQRDAHYMEVIGNIYDNPDLIAWQ